MDKINHWIKNNNITVCTSCRRQQSLEGNRQSSDDGQLSNMICRNEEDAAHTFFQTLLYFLAVLFYVTINMSCAGQCNPLPTQVVVKNMFCSGGPLGRVAPGTSPIGPMFNPAPCVMLCFDDSSGTRLYFKFLFDLTLAVGENPCLHHYNFGGGATKVANLG